VKEYLYKLFNDISLKLEYLKESELVFSEPNIKEHGDISFAGAMKIAKTIKKNPLDIANEIKTEIEKNNISEVFEKIEIAKPGFINFFFKKEFIGKSLLPVLMKSENFGKLDKYYGKTALVEFVSANPTGPLTVGHGRNAVYGDTVANLLSMVGYKVYREYYFNNAGRQMRTLGDSVRIRYLQELGQNIDFPEDYYQGEYIKEIAQKLKLEYNDTLIDEPAEGIFKEIAEREIFKDIDKTLNRLGIKFDFYFNENSLYENGKIKELLEIFAQKNMSYEKDAAIWLKLSELGNEQDKVIVKSTGEPTYRLPDIAYHIDKIKRNYDLIVDVFGSDHNATYPDVLAALKGLGYDISKIKVLIHQFVTIFRDGEIVKMSTRRANYITLDELIDEVGADVVRYFFNMRSITSHLNFDLNLAKKQSEENPVFYVQYAHARICSILRAIEKENIQPSVDNLSLLITEEEQDLIKKILKFEDEVLSAAESFETHRITAYLEDLCSSFHKFYTFRRILGSEKKLAEARAALCLAVKHTIENGLGILGVSAPEKM
jgi:arginyl-tRNA synthetase